MVFFNSTNKPVLSSRLKESGNVFLMLFGAVGMVGVIGASTMTVMKGPVKTMANVTKRTIAENNMIATAKLAIIAAQSNPTPSCDGDEYIEPLPYVTAIGTSGGGTLPAAIGVVKQDPWGNEYIYCAWDHGDEINSGGCSGDNRRAGLDGETEYVLAVISAGPDRVLETTCHDVSDPEETIAMTSGADDLILGYRYDEASAVSGDIWTRDGPDTAYVAKDLTIKDKSTGTVDAFAFDSDTAALTLGAGGSGSFPSVNTDNLQSYNNASISVLSPIASTGNITTTGNVSANRINTSGNATIAGNVSANRINASGGFVGSGASLTALNASQLTTGTLPAARIGTATVTGTHIAANTITAGDIATNGVGADEIAANAVGQSEIATNGVAAAEIAANAVGASEIAANAVGASEIAANAVGASEIAANAVGQSEIATNGVASAEIQNNSITLADIHTGTFPVCTGTGKALQYNGSSFSCANVSSGGGSSGGASCASTNVNWSGCNKTTGTGVHNSTKTLVDSVLCNTGCQSTCFGYVGSATFKCNNGIWQLQAGSTCTLKSYHNNTQCPS